MKRIVPVIGLVVCTIAAAVLAAYVPDPPAKGESADHTLHYFALLPIAGIAVCGFWIRMQQRQVHTKEMANSDGLGFDKAAGILAGAISALEARLDADDAQSVLEAQETLDRLDVEVVDAVVQRGPSLSMELGLTTFAEKMSEFARGERAMHRAWSALTDHHVHGARLALAEARECFAGMTQPAE